MHAKTPFTRYEDRKANKTFLVTFSNTGEVTGSWHPFLNCTLSCSFVLIPISSSYTMCTSVFSMSLYGFIIQCSIASVKNHDLHKWDLLSWIRFKCLEKRCFCRPWHSLHLNLNLKFDALRKLLETQAISARKRFYMVREGGFGCGKSIIDSILCYL